ncbi:MAG: 4-hydroxy-tetrahydrodipicolinate synthase [Deltaproteobacteria bacterium]|nr:MAG: 4-hydroxy-tetrahydrodipicolinate synthase [Deltaproteobacteria bacterium]
MFEGTYTAIVTPFAGGGVDEEALRALVREQVEAGVDGIVPCGSTGESATLDHAEHERVIAICVEEAAGRVKVIAGTGSNSTREAARLTAFARGAGADAALLISPYYNKPTQEGHVVHYREIAAAAGDLPLIIYNIPGRTGVNMTPETIARIAEIPQVVGVKEASGSLDQVSRIIALAGEEFTVLSGDDSLTLPMMAVGAKGVISVTSNLLPRRFAELVRAAAAGDFATARAIHFELLPLMQALFLETNPIPVKTALAMLGKIRDELRLPLTPMSPEPRARLERVLAECGLKP